MSTLKQSVESFHALEQRAQDAAVLIELAEESDDTATANELVSELGELEKAIEVAELDLMFSGPHDHSDAIITKGIVNLLIRVLSGQSPEDIINADMKYIDSIGLRDHLSPTRSNGLLAMIKQMKLYAVVFKAREGR